MQSESCRPGPWPHVSSPAAIWFANTTPSQGGEEMLMTVTDLEAMVGDGFRYSESVECDVLLPSEPRAAVEEHVRLFQDHCVAQWQCRGTNDALLLCPMGDDLGFGLFARRDFRCGDYVCTYSGTIQHAGPGFDFSPYALAYRAVEKKVPSMQDVLAGTVSAKEVRRYHESLGVDSSHKGNLARFIQHLPLRVAGSDEAIARSRAQSFLQFVHDGDEAQFLSAWLRFHAIFHQAQPLLSVKKKGLLTWKLCQLPDRDPLDILVPIFRPKHGLEESAHDFSLDWPQEADDERIQAFLDGRKMTVDCKDSHVEAQVAVENLEQITISREGQATIFVFVAKMDIAQGDILGFNYGYSYWLGAGTLPCLLTRQGRLVPKTDYKYRAFMVKTCSPQGFLLPMAYSSEMYIDHLSSRIGGHLTQKQSRPAIITTKDFETKDFVIFISFYEMRRKLVSVNVLSSDHSPLPIENDPCAHIIRALLPDAFGVWLFRRNPLASKESEDHQALDVVCSAASLDSYIKMATIFSFAGLPANLPFVWTNIICREVILRNVEKGYAQVIALKNISQSQLMETVNKAMEDPTFCKKWYDHIPPAVASETNQYRLWC